jgi:hypothetical protein
MNDGSTSDSSEEGGSNFPPVPGSFGPKSKNGSASSGSPASGKKGSPSGAADSTAASDLLTPDSDSGDGSSGGSPPGQIQMGGPGATIRLGNQGKRKESDKEDPDAGRRLAEEDAKTGGSRGRTPHLWCRTESQDRTRQSLPAGYRTTRSARTAGDCEARLRARLAPSHCCPWPRMAPS